METRPDLADLVGRVERGEEIVITRAGEPVARLEGAGAADVDRSFEARDLLERFKAARRGFALGEDSVSDLLDR